MFGKGGRILRQKRSGFIDWVRLKVKKGRKGI